MNQAVVKLDERRERAQAAATGQRVDMYILVHKGIRAFMGAALEAVGRLDAYDREEVARTLAEVRSLGEFLRAHLHHENQFVHPALEARRPCGTRRTAGDHVGHERALERLESAALAIERADDAARPAAVLALYRELALFTAENLEHMHFEETENNAQLWAAYTDAELQRIHQAMLASIKPEIFSLGLRWMVPAMAPAERAALLTGMQAVMPSETFVGVLGALSARLSERDWAKLMAAIGPFSG
jgi:Hemerythrin HHE cation binding domain